MTVNYKARARRKPTATRPKDGASALVLASKAAGRSSAAIVRTSTPRGKSSNRESSSRPKDGGRARTRESKALRLVGVVQYGPGEPWQSEGQCGPKGRARSLWTAVLRYQSEHRAEFKALMLEFYGLKARDSVVLESLLFDAQLTNRVQTVKKAGRTVHRVSIDPNDRWVLEVWA